MWLIVSVSCCILYLLKIMWSRRRFYYLSSKLNGPIGWPLIGNALELLDSSALNTFLKLTRTYVSPGSLWFEGIFYVYFDRPEEVEAVLTSPASVDKGDVYKYLTRMFGGDGLFTIGGEVWKFHRKLLSPTIQNYNILNSFYPTFNKNLRVMVDLLENKVGKGSFDIKLSLEACSFDTVCETTFGVAMNSQGGENLTFLDSVNNLMQIIEILSFKPWYRFYPIYRLSKYYQLGEESTQIGRLYVKKILDKKIEELKSRNRISEIQNESNEFEKFEKRPVKSFIGELVRLSMEQKCFSVEEMITEAVSMMGAGYETTATTVSHIVLMLALHSDYQERVFQELRDIFPEQRSDVTAEDIAKFQYTEQFINESMRYTPTVPLINKYVKNDLKIGEHTIPGGSEIIIPIISLHRNPLVWGEKADVFDPDNFLPEACMKRHPYAFIPFSVGLRNCIGKKYAKIAIRIFVAWIVRNYRFTTDLKMEELSFKYSITMKIAQHHMVYIHKRESY